MAVSGIGGVAPGTIRQGGPRGPERPDAAAQAQAQAQAAEARRQATLDEVREKGLYAWAKEEKRKALEETIRRQVLSEMGLSEAGLAALSPEKRAALEARIQEEIERRMREAIEQAAKDEMKKAAETGRPPAPVLFDFSV